MHCVRVVGVEPFMCVDKGFKVGSKGYFDTFKFFVFFRYNFVFGVFV